ncbi:MAG: hypothetical protein HY720_30875 [Planctomycetes bacterium]|nr:hypothetical protein [Planctomycetota bacterium]
MRRLLVASFIALLLSLALGASGCSHHADHHALGEVHAHHAPHVLDVHDPYDAHHEDSDPDTVHGH